MTTNGRRGGSKRRRTDRPDPDIVGINVLPHAILTDVASYLPKPSRVMFAVAMTAPSSSWSWKRQPSAASEAIILSPSPQYWDVLDFEEIEKDLAGRLTDGDIGAMLLCINAKNNLKRLMLAGCVKIIGHGLGPLRGSKVIEQVDLSLVGRYESPEIDPGPAISMKSVLPILDSIIVANSFEHLQLKHLQLPVQWRKEGGCTKIRLFLDRYKHHLEGFHSKCSKCRVLLGERRDVEYVYSELDDSYFGLQNYTCSGCLKTFCYDCKVDDENVDFINYCDWCEKDYCFDCAESDMCTICGGTFCSGCARTTRCQTCAETFCLSCQPEGCACPYAR